MDVLAQMEAYAKEHNVPIMEQEGIAFLCSTIEQHRCKHILEIGTAIGYSAIRMAMVDDAIEVVSIERDDERYEEAVRNIKLAGMEDRITLIHEDALLSTVTGTFDLLFIDAAKAQYIKFFERYEPQLCANGVIVSDNLSFHGYVEHPEAIRSRHLRQMVKKIRLYIEYLENRSDYETEFYDLGDGVALSYKKEEK